MQALQFARSIPNSLSQTWQRINQFGQSITQRIAHQWKAIHQESSKLWYESSFYRQHIKPLTKTDYRILGGSLAITALITAIALHSLSFAFSSAVMGLNTLIVMSAVSLCRYRTRKHFDRIAWGHIDQIREIAQTMTVDNQKFAEISKLKGELLQIEFDHLKDERAQLDQEIKIFQEAVTSKSPHLEDRRKALIEHLQALQKKLGGSNTISRK